MKHGPIHRRHDRARRGIDLGLRMQTALCHGDEQARVEALPGHVGEDDTGGVRPELHVVVVIPTDIGSRHAVTGNLGVLDEEISLRQHRHLNLVGSLQILLPTLTFEAG